MTPPKMLSKAPLAAVLLTAAMFAGACSGDSASESSSDTTTATAQDAAGIRLVGPTQGLVIQDTAPEDLVILDVRTPEEFAEGHLEGAILVDFYAEDFADQLAELDRDVPYLMYCRSGNRSGQAAEIMKGLGFTDVANVDGGIVSWANAGNPIVQS